MKSKAMWIILTLVVAAIAAAAFILWRRGRKVRIAEPYRLNRSQLIWLQDADLMPYEYYDGTLDSVWVPYRATTIPKGNTEFVPVVAVGVQNASGRIERKKVDNKYIEKTYLSL